MNNRDTMLEGLEILASAVNYRDWIYSNFKESIGNRVVEVGAGIGNFTRLLLDRELVIALDTNALYLTHLKANFSGHTNIVPLEMDISSSESLSLSQYRIDSILCSNVLEHIKDDDAALANMYKILEEKGKLSLLVPAFQFLHGSIDRLIGHHRRYGKKELLLKLTNAGFEVEEIYYMNSISVPGWFLNNRILKKNSDSPTQIKIFDKFVVPWLKIVEQVIRPPFGLSLVAICEKRKN